MKQILLLLTYTLFLFSCTKDKEVLIYYDTGELKALKIFNNRKDTSSYAVTTFYKSGETKTEEIFLNGKPTGNYTAYYDNGNIFETYTYLDGFINGRAKQFDPKGELTKEYFYLRGVASSLLLHNNQNDSLPRGFSVFKIDSTENASQIGQIVYDTSGRIDSDYSFYYDFTMQDTMCLGQNYSFNIRGYNFNYAGYSLEVLLLNKNHSFIFPDTSDQIKLHSKELSIDYDIIPNKKGLINLYGYVMILPENSNLGYQFPILEEVFCDECAPPR